MMTVEIHVKGKPVTKVSVINKCPYDHNSDTEDDHHCVYEWNAWRIHPDHPQSLHNYAAGELIHRREDGVEELSVKVLSEYASLKAETSA